MKMFKIRRSEWADGFFEAMNVKCDPSLIGMLRKNQ